MRLLAQTKQAVIERASGCCEYCRTSMLYSSDPLAVEHIMPRAKGGTNHLSNLALSCFGCNNVKYTSIEAVDPDTSQTAPLFNPRQHRWNEHFVWSEDFTRMAGQTPIGRATIEKLHLNREGVVNLRRAIRLMGAHPPEPTRHDESL